MMRRRALLQGLVGSAAGAVAGFRLHVAHAAGPFAPAAVDPIPAAAGKFLVCVQADGGWDPTSFCDPKPNVAGEAVINHWSSRAEVRTIGNLAYAPFANNQAFFEKHHQRMLVINGVDAQTNSHTVGVVHNWSGRNSEGYPTLTALLAGPHGETLPTPYLSFGGYAETAGVVRATRLGEPTLLRDIAAPAASPWVDTPFFNDADWATLQAHGRRRAERLATMPGLSPAEARRRRTYQLAFATEGLRAYADALPPPGELAEPERYTGVNGTYHSTLRRQAQLAVLAFKTGVAVSADLWAWGFDTHANHDGDHAWLLGNLTDAVSYLWDYAEQHGVADRLVVVIGSDFGRTNRYNAAGGKDHWPIGSVVVMEDNQPWTGRAVGETDELHFAAAINPATLQRDDRDGIRLHPKHIHKALRAYLGIAPGGSATSSPPAPATAERFPLNDAEDFAFFG